MEDSVLGSYCCCVYAFCRPEGIDVAWCLTHAMMFMFLFMLLWELKIQEVANELGQPSRLELKPRNWFWKGVDQGRVEEFY